MSNLSLSKKSVSTRVEIKVEDELSKYKDLKLSQSKSRPVGDDDSFSF